MIHKRLRLFVNTLAVDDKHYLLNIEHLTEAIEIQLSQKEKIYSKVFFAFLKSILNVKHFHKEWLSYLMYFRKYLLRKTWLDKCLKSRVSENPYTDNAANVSKHCCNRNGSSFIIFINHCQGSCIGKCLF